MTVRAVRRVLVLVVTLGLVAGCSISTNEEPVAVEEVFDHLVSATTSSSTTSTPPEASRTAIVYFVRSTDGATALVPVEREVAVDAGVAEILTNLFTVPPASGDDAPLPERGLSTAIPDTATLRSAQLAEGTRRLVVDTQGLFGERGVQGTQLRNALAQIVCTSTRRSNVEEVSFQNEGSPVSAIIGSNDLADGPVDCSDYRELR